MKEEYNKVVTRLENNLSDYATKSFESNYFVDGGDVFKYYNDAWQDDSENLKLNNRTPIQHQRDRILYSNGLRKQSEKYHVLYNGNKRIIRNYITHTMRMMQVTRTICRSLHLNEDFAEAIVLGSKVGSLPFIHASKSTVSEWVSSKISKIDEEKMRYSNSTQKTQQFPFPDEKYLPNYPAWIRQIKNRQVKEDVEQFIPFAIGQKVNEAYSSGKQGYWLLTTNPYTLESNKNSFIPEIMFAIWRHSLNSPYGKDSFTHLQKIKNASNGTHKIEWNNISFESIVVQYADDITWVIENLNDANNAMALNNSGNNLFIELMRERNFPHTLSEGLFKSDSGRLYSYFINDFINHSKKLLEGADGAELKMELKSGESSQLIGLSNEGIEILQCFKNFLEKIVFNEKRVLNRKRMLETITMGCMDLLYEGKEDFLKSHIENVGQIDGWGSEQKKLAQKLLDDEVHRVQVSVNVFSQLSDQEIFSFVGMDPF